MMIDCSRQCDQVTIDRGPLLRHPSHSNRRLARPLLTQTSTSVLGSSTNMSAATHSIFSRLTALIIDDQRPMQTLHKNQLQDIGFTQIDLATGPNDALALLRSKNYDLVLCDHDLRSHTDGQQLLELLRNENILPLSTIFVMITGNNFRSDVAAASEHQPDDYILKPITVRSLEDRLMAILKRRAALTPVL